jgi:two-component system cell cycle sensor histidine kinase PleC
VSLARVFEDCHHLLKLRIGTEAIVTFPPERVMAALAPIADRARPLQPQADVSSASKRKEMPILKRY